MLRLSLLLLLLLLLYPLTNLLSLSPIVILVEVLVQTFQLHGPSSCCLTTTYVHSFLGCSSVGCSLHVKDSAARYSHSTASPCRYPIPNSNVSLVRPSLMSYS